MQFASCHPLLDVQADGLDLAQDVREPIVQQAVERCERVIGEPLPSLRAVGDVVDVGARPADTPLLPRQGVPRRRPCQGAASGLLVDGDHRTMDGQLGDNGERDVPGVDHRQARRDRLGFHLVAIVATEPAVIVVQRVAAVMRCAA